MMNLLGALILPLLVLFVIRIEDICDGEVVAGEPDRSKDFRG